MKKILLLMTMVLTCVGAWAQTPILTYENITELQELSDEDAQKIREISTAMTIIADVTITNSASPSLLFSAVADYTSSSTDNNTIWGLGFGGNSLRYFVGARTGGWYSTKDGDVTTSVTKIAFTYDGTTIKRYVDGVAKSQVNSTKALNTFVGENAKFYLGGVVYNNNTKWAEFGGIKKIVFYNKVYNDNEISIICSNKYSNTYITDPEQFENGKIYNFVTKRGMMGANSNKNNVLSTVKASNGLTADKYDDDFQWTVYKSENGNYYLYNIGKGMFMGVQASNNASVPFVASPAGKKLTFKVSNNVEYPIMFSTNNAAVVNHSADHGDGLISWTDGWGNPNDEGSNHKVELVGDLNEEILAKIEKLVAVREIGYFRLKGHSGNYIDASATWGSNGQMSMKAEADCNPAGAIFYYDDNNGFLNYANGRYINETRALAVNNAMGNTWSVYISATEGKYKLQSNQNNWLHDNEGTRADRCSSESNHGNTTHSWTIEKVTSLPVTISAAKYATFYAPVAVEVPEGVTAHTVTINGEWATLSEALEVIPANTGVVLYSETAGTYNFAITEDVEAISGNALRGSVATTYYTTAGTYYALGRVEGVVGFYKDSFNNNRFQNNSHKAYLYMENANQVKAFLFEDGETTAIETVETENVNAPIYDLSGRRVVNTVKGGIYIQNGKKFIVK